MLRTKLQVHLHHFETAEPTLQLAETSSSEACPLDSPEQLAGGGQQQFVADLGEAARAVTEFHNTPNAWQCEGRQREACAVLVEDLLY